MFQITAPTTNSLTASLDSILVFPTMNMDFDYFPNVKIIVNADREVPVHHCVLSARSEFFKNVFSVKDSGSSAAMASSSVAAPRFELKELAKEYDWMRSSLFWGICTAGSSGVCLKAFASAWTTLAHTSLVGRWLISRWSYVWGFSSMASRKIWYSWRHQIGFLAKHGYHVVAPDMRGYGDTDAPLNPTSYSILHLVDDLVGLLDHFGGQQTFVVGHDHGSLGKEKRENQPKKKQKQKAKVKKKSEIRKK
ncbi:hypothetical protein ACFX15_001588 [Malus domestica]